MDFIKATCKIVANKDPANPNAVVLAFGLRRGDQAQPTPDLYRSHLGLRLKAYRL